MKIVHLLFHSEMTTFFHKSCPGRASNGVHSGNFANCASRSFIHSTSIESSFFHSVPHPGTGSAEISPACKEILSIRCRINGSYILRAQREAAYVGPPGKASRRR